jgi:hypothetical protein
MVDCPIDEILDAITADLPDAVTARLNHPREDLAMPPEDNSDPATEELAALLRTINATLLPMQDGESITAYTLRIIDTLTQAGTTDAGSECDGDCGCDAEPRHETGPGQ